MKKLYPFEVEQKASRFLACESLLDLEALGFDNNQLIFNALNPAYYSFETQKRKGGKRSIEAPAYELKEIQRQFNSFLQCVYYGIQTTAAYGYIIRLRDQVHEKNILGNAKKHHGSHFMLNVDFEDFFHQITSQKILDILQTKPFRFQKEAAQILTKLFTYNKKLPMGAPTSPVFSNLATISLDKKLNSWANKHQITYTRFVDDLTFSSRHQALDSYHLEAIQNICKHHDLKLNPYKTLFYGREETKKVTGLVLNETIDIDPDFYHQLNKDLWRLQHAVEVNFIMNKHNQSNTLKEFEQEVEGQINFIGMIEGYGSALYRQYKQKLKKALQPNDEALSVRWTNFNYL